MHHSKILKFFAPLCFVVLFSSSLSASEKITVKVGGYEFPPFVEKSGKDGMVSELITKINRSQDKFHFIFVETSANRRYRDLEDKKYDLIFFEDEAWSWGKSKFQYLKTGVILNGGENFIALNKGSRDQSFFDSFENKKIRAIFGYHYNFANMKTDPEMLRKKGISLSESNEENLKDLLKERVDIVVMNSFVLDNYFKKDKILKDKLLISSKRDQTYNLRILLNKSSSISAQEIESLTLANLK